jgi:hypothetical protein
VIGSNATIATANKLSKIIWNMLVKNQPYNPVMPTEYLDKIRKNEIKNIQSKIRQLNIREGEILFCNSLIIRSVLMGYI